MNAVEGSSGIARVLFRNDRIEISRGERRAASEAIRGLKQRGKKRETFETFYRVRGAGWIKPAPAGHHPSEAGLVQTNHCDSDAIHVRACRRLSFMTRRPANGLCGKQFPAPVDDRTERDWKNADREKEPRDGRCECPESLDRVSLA